MQYLQNKNLPKLNGDLCALCEKDITEEEIKYELNKMEINKSRGNDGLTKEFYEAFWDHVKVCLLLSFKMAFLKKELSTSQKNVAIKLIEKKDCDKRFTKKWLKKRPISWLNVDVKLISNVVSNRIKNLLPNLISNNQNAYVANRFISEAGRIISDILEMIDILNMDGYLLTIDIEKVFDSVDHYFLLAILEKYGFKKNFLRWIETLLNNQESCIINCGITTYYFKLKKGTRQGDPISAYLFILVL